MTESQDQRKKTSVYSEKKLDILGNAYESPLKSSELSTYTVTEGKISYDFFLQDIECKTILLSIYELDEDEKKKYAIPMLH